MILHFEGSWFISTCRILFYNSPVALSQIFGSAELSSRHGRQNGAYGHSWEMYQSVDIHC